MPAVTALLLSSAALALSATADQLMSGGLTRTAHEALVAAGPLGTGGCLHDVRLDDALCCMRGLQCCCASLHLHQALVAVGPLGTGGMGGWGPGMLGDARVGAWDAREGGLHAPLNPRTAHSLMGLPMFPP